eukprot:s810_g35.t1
MVSAGTRHTVLLRSDGHVVTCGEHIFGQRDIPPLPLHGGATYTQVSAGYQHTMLLRSDGQAVGCRERSCNRREIPPLDVGVRYTQVSGGFCHTAFLRSDGRAVACGENRDGRCNIPSSHEDLTYTQVSAGYRHTGLLRSDGSAVACGWNDFGQCDIPPLDEGITYTQVSAGHEHTVLLRSDGRAVACGNTNDGQCDIPPLDEGITYTQVFAGEIHTVLLRSDGHAVACGERYLGRCDIPPLNRGVRYTQLAAGACHTVLLRSDGRAVACGSNDFGQSNGNGRTIRNLLESSFRHMALRVLKGTEPEDLTKFYEGLPQAPPMDCSGMVSVGGYSGPDLRCTFSDLEGSDILATTADLVNLNLAPCKMSVTKAEVESVANKGQDWPTLAAAISKVTSAKTGDKMKLQEACSEVSGILGSGSALIELEEEEITELQQANNVTKGNPTRGYTAMPDPGWCKDAHKKMYVSFKKSVPTLEECVEICDGRDTCKGFAHQLGACHIYTDAVPRSSTGSPRRLQCYQRNSAASSAGVSKPVPAPKKATVKPTYNTGSRNPGPKPIAKPRKPTSQKKRKTWQASKPGSYDSRKKAEQVIEQNEVPGGTNEKVDKLMGDLNKLVGLTKVKAGMSELRAMVEFDQWRKRLLPDAKTLMGQSFHMQFLGNPGTGKTVVARMVGKLLVEMGVIKKVEKSEQEKDSDVFVEVSRADLVAEYKGQTAPKVLGAVAKAMGGVLFVDEAYSLKKEGKDSFGQEAVDTLIKEIEDKRDQVIAIFAGYEKEMETFFEANPGFKSRVPFKFYFDDYTCDELNHIGGIFMGDKGFRTSEGATKWLNRTIRFSTGCCDGDQSECEALRDSGNGRTVRNILEASYRNFAARIVPRLYHSKSVRPVLDRIEEFAKAKEENYDAYKLKYGTGKILRKKLKKDFGLDAICSRQPSGHGEMWSKHCDEARSKLKVLQGEDIALVAASRISETLLSSCREAKKDMKVLDELSASALQVISDEDWEEVSDLAHDADCEGTFEALEKVPNPPPAPVYDNLQLMEDSEELKPLLEKLRSLVGLKSVKEAMGQLFGLVKLSLWREQLGMKGLGGQSFHMRFLGNPGTGKTVVARIVGEMMVKMGVVDMPAEVKKRLKEEAKIQSIREDREVGLPLIFKEAARVDMVAQYLGQTAPKVEKAVAGAIGGVLFIDEAYALDSFGQEAVDTLIKEMEDKRKNVIVILAGYEAEMDSFFDSNPGFKSRVPFTFRFEDYSCTELGQIGSLVLNSQGLSVAPDAP